MASRVESRALCERALPRDDALSVGERDASARRRCGREARRVRVLLLMCAPPETCALRDDLGAARVRLRGGGGRLRRGVPASDESAHSRAQDTSPHPLCCKSSNPFNREFVETRVAYGRPATAVAIADGPVAAASAATAAPTLATAAVSLTPVRLTRRAPARSAKAAASSRSSSSSSSSSSEEDEEARTSLAAAVRVSIARAARPVNSVSRRRRAAFPRASTVAEAKNDAEPKMRK